MAGQCLLQQGARQLQDDLLVVRMPAHPDFIVRVEYRGLLGRGVDAPPAALDMGQAAHRHGHEVEGLQRLRVDIDACAVIETTQRQLPQRHMVHARLQGQGARGEVQAVGLHDIADQALYLVHVAGGEQQPARIAEAGRPLQRQVGR